MKTRAEIYGQWQRMFAALMRRGIRLAKKADPATGGNDCLVHNWGNDAARNAWRQTWDLERAVRAIYSRLYDAAEHRTHGPTFKPLWCDACQRMERTA